MTLVFVRPTPPQFSAIPSRPQLDVDENLRARTGFTQDEIKTIAAQGLPDIGEVKIINQSQGDHFELAIAYQGPDYEHTYMLNFAENIMEGGTMLSMRQDGIGRHMTANAAIVSLITGMKQNRFGMGDLMGAAVWPKSGAEIDQNLAPFLAQKISFRFDMISRFLKPKKAARIRALCTLKSPDALYKLAKINKRIPFIPQDFEEAQKATDRPWTHENYKAKGFFRDIDRGIKVPEFLLCGLHMGATRRYESKKTMRRLEKFTRTPIRLRALQIMAAHGITQPTQSVTRSSTPASQTARPQ